MNASQVFFIVFTVAAVAVLCVWLIHALKRETASADEHWEDLVARLDSVNREVVHAIAVDLLEGHDQIAPESLFSMLGGLDGLERLERNCDVLVRLATFVQRWHPEALVVAEELRLSAREMKWHLERLRGAENAGHLNSTFPDYAQQAVRVYYGMTQKVLSLVEEVAFDPGGTLHRSL